MVEPGRRCLGDRYELHQLIAAGGMGQVWRGLDIALHRPVAVKVLRSEYTGDPTFVARFRAEAQHAAALSHPNIAAVFDYGEETAQDGSGETLAYLVMELVEGEPLSALLRREGALPAPTTLELLRQTASALAEAHRVGMVHRDVKPGNILVRPDGTVKITDFGIAWSARSVALTRTGQVIGTPQYLSPEQAEGRHASPASDVYALGLIGYECLTGRPAFEGDNAVTIALKQVQQEPEPLPDELPPGVRTLIGRALLKNPSARIPDGAAFVAAIADVEAGREIAPAEGTVTAAAVAGPLPVSAPGERRRSASSRPGGSRTEPGFTRPPAARRRNRLTVVLLPLLGLLAGAGITAAVLHSLTQETPATTASAAEQPISGSFVLDEDDYVGRPVGEVTDRLTALGLTVTVRAEARDDVVPDRVTGVEPAGRQLRAGDEVVVYYAAAAERRSSNPGSAQTGAAVDPGPVAPATQEPVVEEAEPAAPTTEESAPTPTLAATPTTQAPEPTEPEQTASPSSASPTTASPAATTTPSPAA
ncbi:serine/threonine protein kinase [Blastococcus sp. TBT05-19]|uniref:serine/threonine protein kinase n=1 Tax=Blastococcus sp. TBT05-19 TaxID=2250581 RepID=UPI001F22BA35|nr:serine/threonine protein kinase [Blastococcus sp. TBT05-19]